MTYTHRVRITEGEHEGIVGLEGIAQITESGKFWRVLPDDINADSLLVPVWGVKVLNSLPTPMKLKKGRLPEGLRNRIGLEDRPAYFAGSWVLFSLFPGAWSLTDSRTEETLGTFKTKKAGQMVITCLHLLGMGTIDYQMVTVSPEKEVQVLRGTRTIPATEKALYSLTPTQQRIINTLVRGLSSVSGEFSIVTWERVCRMNEDVDRQLSDIVIAVHRVDGVLLYFVGYHDLQDEGKFKMLEDLPPRAILSFANRQKTSGELIESLKEQAGRLGDNMGRWDSSDYGTPSISATLPDAT